MIRIAISAAFPAIRDSHPVGSRRSEPQRTSSGNFFIWVPNDTMDKLEALRAVRGLERRDRPVGGGRAMIRPFAR